MSELALYLISLGCAKNLVDSERLLASAEGLGLALADRPEGADLIVVNTCAFLESAVSEAIECILETAGRRKAGARLMVVGCLPGRYRNITDLPEVDVFLPPDQYAFFAVRAAELLGLAPPPAESRWPLAADGRLLSRRAGTPFFRAFLKIAEGCDNRCTYCRIPAIRGSLVSYPPEALTAEAARLVAGGVRELTLVAQDLTVYGRDLAGRPNLASLAADLAEIPGLDWLRLLYAYPERLTDGLVRRLAALPKVTPYLDLPFQHAVPRVLKRMGRPFAVPPLERVERLRRLWPGVALRTTLMVGFPGETEEDFAQLADFVERAAFEHLGVFKFSPEEGSPAARLPEQTPQGVKEKRRRRLMALQRRISLAKNRARLGRTVEVLVEGRAGPEDLVAVGRAAFQAPEVDGLVYFEGEQPQAGALVKARLTKASAYDLAAEMV